MSVKALLYASHRLRCRYDPTITDTIKNDYPNAYVIEYSSDTGNHTEAFLRYTIWDFVDFMNNHGVKGIKGENS